MPPRQYKLGDEGHNTALRDARIKAGKSWMSYLPQSFNNELIASAFMDIDVERAERALYEYDNKHQQMNPMDSVAVKGCVGLNDTQYARLIRALHYFVGMRIVLPVMAIYLLQDEKIKRDYTILLRIVVHMTQKTNNGNVTIVRKIKG